MTMERYFKGAAKCLTFSLMLAALLGGCAVYEPAYGPYGPAPYGPYGPAPYGPPVYSNAPYFVEPPVSLNFGFGFESPSRRRGHGFHGGRWRDGHRR